MLKFVIVFVFADRFVGKYPGGHNRKKEQRNNNVEGPPVRIHKSALERVKIVLKPVIFIERTENCF
jgi:hypothetical protein